MISDAVLLECKTWVAYALDSGRAAPHEGVRFRARAILGLDIQTATGAYLDALCGIPTRPAGMTDAELRKRYLNLHDNYQCAAPGCCGHNDPSKSCGDL